MNIGYKSTTMERKWEAYSNKNLLVPESVVLNERLNSTLVAIDKYWPPNAEKVTSGVRKPEDSLRIIRNYLKSKGLSLKYPEAMTCGMNDENPDGTYKWQKAWSHLLNIGVIINPPLEAHCLMDYYRNGVNKIGQLIRQSPHTRGTAFDLSGIDSLTIVKRLLEDKMIRSYLVERENNCIHIDI
jgi:hypothetical protein